MIESHQWAGMSALIVSDNNGFRSVIRSHCQRIGMRRVETANSEDEALTFLTTNDYSVVIVHVQTNPGGMDFVQNLRKSGARIPSAEQVPVVIVSNEGATPQMIFEAADAGANYLAQLALSAQALMKAITIAVTQPNAFSQRVQTVRSKMKG